MSRCKLFTFNSGNVLIYSFTMLQSWKEIAMLLEERVQNLDSVLTEFEKYQLHTGLSNNEDDLCVTLIKHGQDSLGQSCRSLKSRAQITLKLLSSLKS